MPTGSEQKPAYGKPPRFTPAELQVILKTLTETAWLKSEDYDDFKSALKKLEDYAASLP
jgi:hypothetical protein